MTHHSRPQVFQCGPGPAFTDYFQDILRQTMLADVPKQHRPKYDKAGIVNCNTEKSARAAAERARNAPAVVRMFQRGMTKLAISKDLGVSDFYVTRILEEAGVQSRYTSNRVQAAAARRSEYAPRILQLRKTGASHAAIGAAIGLASATVARIIKEHGQ